jgi:hypothetical protein
MRQSLEVVTRGKLGNDPTEVLVQIDLRVDDVGQDPPSAVYQGNRGLVAASFDSEDEARFYCCSPLVIRSRRRPRTSASIRSRLAS